MTVSIIIPTRNRHDQLYQTLMAHRALPVYFRDSVQLVVADNSTKPMPDNHLREIHELFPHFIYENERESISLGQNFLRGLNLSTNHWLCAIGDDDFFLPELVNAANIYNDQPVDCIVYNPPKYYWPSCVFSNPEVSGAPGAFIKAKPFQDRFIDIHNEINGCLGNGGLTIGKLPRFYHGLVRRDAILLHCLNENNEFNLGSPDISFAFHLALGKIKTISYSKALTVYGASTGSGGGMTTSKTHLLPLDEAHHLSKHFRENWDSRIPRYWSEFTVFPSSILYVAKLKNTSIDSRISFSAIYSAILIYEKANLDYVKNAFFQHRVDVQFSIALGMIFHITKKMIGSIYRRMKAFSSRNFVIFDTAYDFLSHIVNNHEKNSKQFK